MTAPRADTDLPRLTYVGDVPVERKAAGSMLLYRLLGGYDPDRLSIVVGDTWPEGPVEIQLPGVSRERWRYLPSRMLTTRFHEYVSAWVTCAATWSSASLARRLAELRSEAVVTVAHGHLWLTACAAARRLGIPVHLIVHDDWATCHTMPSWLRSWCARRFAFEYRQATTRLCVCQEMADCYEREIGVPGVALYPTRGEESVRPIVRSRPATDEFVVAYAGTLNTPAYFEMLARVAEALRSLGGKVDLYTPESPDALARRGLSGDTVRSRGFLPPRQLAETIANTADCLFLPISFSPNERRSIETAFPSKLCEYTAIGLPVFAWAPPSASVSRWLRDRPGAAMLLETDDNAELRRCLSELKTNPTRRRRLAQGLIDAGDNFFSLDRGRALFLDAVAGRLRSATSRSSVESL